MTVIISDTPGSASASSTRLLTPLTDDDFRAFQKLTSQQTDSGQYPLSSEVSNNVIIYSADSIPSSLRKSESKRQALMDEWQRALLSGPGVFVIKGMIPADIIDRADAVSKEIEAGRDLGKNSRRIFGYSEKHAVHDPESFADYYGNEILSSVCESWLGPGYQITATINATIKGGNQQDIHRDYHVSHQSLDRIHRFPVTNQIASQFLTLQSAIAHTDMPLSTGPTRFTPFSQLFPKGYIAVRDPRYIDYVKSRMVQLPLEKGDAVFFNPATFHQPGVNETERERVANLLQVSSAFGRSMESCDRLKMSKAIWPVVKRWNGQIQAGKKTQAQLDAVIAAACSDYGYPKIMDLIKPGPDCQADILKQALVDGKSDEEVYAALDGHGVWHKP